MTGSASRCDQIIALIDACLAEVDTTPGSERRLQDPRRSQAVTPVASSSQN
jgi:hypothetical protein